MQLEHGKPLIFGKNRDKGIRLNRRRLRSRASSATAFAKAICSSTTTHHSQSGLRLHALAKMEEMPGFPTPIGVLRAWDDVAAL